MGSYYEDDDSMGGGALADLLRGMTDAQVQTFRQRAGDALKDIAGQVKGGQATGQAALEQEYEQGKAELRRQGLRGLAFVEAEHALRTEVNRRAREMEQAAYPDPLDGLDESTLSAKYRAEVELIKHRRDIDGAQRMRLLSETQSRFSKHGLKVN